MIRDVRYRLLLTFLIAGISILLPFISVTPVHAHALVDPITVDSRNSVLHFPKSIDFELQAHDNQAALTQATIYLKYNGSLSFQQQQDVSAPTQGESETFSWEDDLTSNANAFPPAGTQVSYYWIIQDANGNSHTDSIQTFEIVDNRFQWQHLSQGLYQVNWYDQQDNFGQTILNQVTTNAQRISNNLGGGPQKQINLWVYSSEDDFKGSLPPDVHEWVGGIAFPAINQASIVVTSLTDSTLSRDMPHEITHLIFHQLVLPYNTPTWFDEGMAVYNQTYHEYEMDARFKTALTTHSLLPLSTIDSSFPADADTAYLAYAESWQLLDYMYKTFGQNKMHALIKAMHRSYKTFDSDLQQALGVDDTHLEEQWLLYLGQPVALAQGPQTQDQPGPVSTTPAAVSNTTPMLMVLGIALIFVPVFGFGGLLIYQRRTKQKARVQQPGQGQLSSLVPQGPIFQQGMPWYPPTNPSSPYGQHPQAPSTMPPIHPGNYTSPEAYTSPTMQKSPVPASTIPGGSAHTILQNPHEQRYPWYPPGSSYPPNGQYPPYTPQSGNTPPPKQPQAPQE
jgi:Peptidase MA superfamily